VAIDANLTLFPKGSASGVQVPVDDSLPRDASGHPQVNFDLSAAQNGSHELVVDFDLANFHLNGAGKIVPVCKEGDKTTLPNPERHENEEYTGFTAEVQGTAPNQEFKLLLANGRYFVVATSEKTAIFNADGSPNPALADHKFVKVRGVFDVTAKKLNASEIKIKQSENAPHEEHGATVVGAPYFVDPSAGTFKIMPGQAEGFVPKEIKVQIATTADTHFWSVSGVSMSKEDFFAIAASAKVVGAHGSYDEASNTITATEVKIINMPDENVPKAVYARGVVSALSADAGTATMSPVVQWEGFVPQNNSVNIVTNGETVYKDPDGNVMDRAAFYESLHVGNGLKVEGILDGGTITARVMRKVL
jgi:hypothetical protein